MSTYKPTFTVAIEEQDDPAARKQAKSIIKTLGEVVEDADVKLHQVLRISHRGVCGWGDNRQLPPFSLYQPFSLA